MKRALAAAIGILTLAALPAFGADIPPRMPVKAPAYVAPVWNWTGFTLGYNWQTGPAVFGIEADLDWARINGSAALCPFGNCFTDMRSFGTVRGRLGYAAGMWMPYITGGLAVADIRAGQDAFGGATTDQWRTGWTVGGGIEAMFAPGWSAKVEYLYADFGSSTTGYTPVGSGVPFTASERNVNIIRGGINYHFGESPVVARY